MVKIFDVKLEESYNGWGIKNGAFLKQGFS
jgi:hypothetical protein